MKYEPELFFSHKKRQFSHGRVRAVTGEKKRTRHRPIYNGHINNRCYNYSRSLLAITMRTRAANPACSIGLAIRLLQIQIKRTSFSLIKRTSSLARDESFQDHGHKILHPKMAPRSQLAAAVTNRKFARIYAHDLIRTAAINFMRLKSLYSLAIKTGAAS